MVEKFVPQNSHREPSTEHPDPTDRSKHESRLATAVEHTAECIIITNIEGVIEYVNPAFEEVTGYLRSEAVGKHIALLDCGQHDAISFSDMLPTLQKGEIWQGRFVNKRKNRSLFEAEVTISPIRNQSGDVVNFVSVQRDVSHVARLEKQLRQAQKMEAIGTLAGGIAHDFNNLLMGIQGNLSLSLVDVDPETALADNLRKIGKYIQSGVDLTRQLLGFARNGKYAVDLINVNELLADQAVLFGRTNKNVAFDNNYEPALWAVEADQGQIEQVLMNLYMNAIQAMPDGGTLYTRTQNVVIAEDQYQPYRVKAGQYVKITVADSGVGMDEKTKQRIFDPFFTTKEMGRGTGLGLASVYGIVKNHEGFTNVTSSKGEGSRFEIYLPGTDKAVAVKEKQIEVLTSGKEHILLIDDEEIILDVGQRMLAKLGYEVIIASDGTSALEIFSRNKAGIDLIILDMVMPKMGGGEVFDRLKKIDSQVKVLLASGYSINGQANSILARGCNGFIQKPFNLQSLSQNIRAILDQ